ncbi:hypothetical protein [Bdellovibrio sp. HCB337]|uniref:hypothetical protein n=1 Tax=Bdellovibrio sp. HCB337 TaxID=3394358 RepID=UPI0039A60C93
MKMMKIVFSIFLGLAILSCSKKDDSQLSVSVVGETSYIIPAPAQSCVNKRAVDLDSTTAATSDISERSFKYNTPTLSWENTANTAYIVALKIEFKGANLDYTCTIAGDELLAIFYNPVTNTDWDGTLGPASSASSPTTLTSPACNIVCGEVSVANEDQPFTASGKMTVIGFERSPTGDEKPIKATSTVKVNFE